jgi:5'-nucleotidase
MRILLTNDDGIDCPGLVALHEALSSLDGVECRVIAPDGNRSGVSNSITLHGAMRLSQRSENSWACSGTPADCALLGVLGAIPFTPDLVLSGINAGPNIGTDIVYSGTAAAARQAALHGVPAIAVSLAGFGAPWHWEAAARFVAERLTRLMDLCVSDVFVNVNIPNVPGGPTDYRLTWPGRRRYNDGLSAFDAPDGHRYFFIVDGGIETEHEEGCDQHALDEGFASVSPVFIHPVVRCDSVAAVPDHAGAAGRPGSAVGADAVERRLAGSWRPTRGSPFAAGEAFE